MVYLTITPAILDAIEYIERSGEHVRWDEGNEQLSQTCPAVGHPISHVKILNIAARIRELATSRNNETLQHVPPHRIDHLLRSSRLYVEPAKPKAEPNSEYKTLMARLRREEEARAYERMINPPPPTETFVQRFPRSQDAHIFPSSQADIGEDDEISYADVNRQMALIANVLLSILACSVAIWVAARYWSTPARLALSMGGSTLVGVAEVVVYSAYIGRLKDARAKGRKAVEIKEVVKTWIIGGDDDKLGEDDSVTIVPKSSSYGAVRRKITKLI